MRQASGQAEDRLRAVGRADLPVAVGTDAMHSLTGFEMEWLTWDGWGVTAVGEVDSVVPSGRPVPITADLRAAQPDRQ